ncbi:MAG: hypothetical protein AUH30_01215 [Candidatus Rokubacteria bacterium 13_1_40CM_68_15]|nr:MAG: hypothetical protein AUH30_01215 [Candidatus Rokubacteria bacterium 13_1_40CM_68_15]
MDGPEHVYDEEPPRSIFSALWFRALIVILVLGVIAAVAVPYVLDIVNPPVVKKAASAPPRPASQPPAPTAPEPAAMSPSLPPPSAPSAQTAPAPAIAPPATAGAIPGKQVDTPPPVEARKPAMDTTRPGTETPKMATAVDPTKPAGSRITQKTSPAAGKSGGGSYWVQVGAFKNQATARALAARLREQNYTVVESVKDSGGGAPAASADTGGAADRYNVFVSGSTPSELTTKLSAKGLAADAVAGGVVVKPSLPLRDAVALSRDLATGGLKVQVRRAGGERALDTSAASASASASAGETLYRVRVGGLADRAAALATLKELEGKGYKPFMGRGGS